MSHPLVRQGNRSFPLVMLFSLLTFTSLPGTASAADKTPPAAKAYVTVGPGLIEPLHLDAGYFVKPNLSVDVRYAWQIFNHMVGIGATWSGGKAEAGHPPRHALLIHGEALVNPVGGLQLESGGERLGSELGIYAGYGFMGEKGLYVRALAGGFLYADQGPAFGPNLHLGVGLAF